jgi:ERO1-like protein alpha
VYVNLLRNPERYTGYKGEHARRVWAAIYSHPALAGLAEGAAGGAAAAAAAPPERRVLFRLVSGLQSSISAHIAADYLLDEAKGEWGPNLELFRARLGNPGVRDRVENLYFTYLFVLRAATKAGARLAAADLDTGSPAEDAAAAALLRQIVSSPALRAACPLPFDEARLWRADGDGALRAELQAAFQNITATMDCVGCEKCKLWGKLQLLGLATSLKVLFAEAECGGGGAAAPPPPLELERNEVIALINLLERLSASVETVRRLSLEAAGPAARAARPAGLGAVQEIVGAPWGGGGGFGAGRSDA